MWRSRHSRPFPPVSAVAADRSWRRRGRGARVQVAGPQAALRPGATSGPQRRSGGGAPRRAGGPPRRSCEAVGRCRWSKARLRAGPALAARPRSARSPRGGSWRAVVPGASPEMTITSCHAPRPRPATAFGQSSRCQRRRERPEFTRRAAGEGGRRGEHGTHVAVRQGATPTRLQREAVPRQAVGATAAAGTFVSTTETERSCAPQALAAARAAPRILSLTTGRCG